jgi:hypothetical protein
MTQHTRSVGVLAGILGALLTSTAAFAQSNEPDSRHTITRESIRRAVLPIDVGDVVAANTQSDNNWRSVTSVKAGADTRVILDDWRTHRGRFVGADERSVTLEINGVNRTFQRAQVRQVDRRGGPSASNAKAWAMAGMVGGLAAGFASCRGQPGECVQGRPLTGMMIGSLAGAIFGATRPSWTPIYAARP